MNRREFLQLGIAGATFQARAASGSLAPAWRGFGADNPGGRGGPVLKVTTLNPGGPGSLRAALEAKGPRIVVFEVGGIVDLAKDVLKITEPFLTVAGETAPSPGITLIRGSLHIASHNIRISHLRFRIGDAGAPKKSGYEPEVTTSAAHDVLIDHCSTSWAVDENLSISGPRLLGPEGTSRRVTLSRNIIAEALHDSSHAKGPHSMGTLVHDFCRDIAIVGNFYAHNYHRNPYYKAFTTGAVVNNLIYNPGTGAISVNYVDREFEGSGIKPENARISVVGNVLRHGVDTREKLPLVLGTRGDVFLYDNLAFDRAGQVVPLTTEGVRILSEKPSWPEGLAPLPASETENWVLANAGARPKDRDAIDQRLVSEYRERGGRIRHSQDEVGGYPRAEVTKRALTPPTDVEAWLAGFAREVEG